MEIGNKTPNKFNYLSPSWERSTRVSAAGEGFFILMDKRSNFVPPIRRADARRLLLQGEKSKLTFETKMIPNIITLNRPKIIDIARGLPSIGNTKLTENNLFYLNVDDSYIHHLFDLLGDDRIKKPDYFGEKSAGAHISIIYPEENTKNKKIDIDDLQQEHRFIVTNIIAAEIGSKIYYALSIESPSLVKLRKKYGFPELLYFRGYSIGFHITIGTIAH